MNFSQFNRFISGKELAELIDWHPLVPIWVIPDPLLQAAVDQMTFDAGIFYWTLHNYQWWEIRLPSNLDLRGQLNIAMHGQR